MRVLFGGAVVVETGRVVVVAVVVVIRVVVVVGGGVVGSSVWLAIREEITADCKASMLVCDASRVDSDMNVLVWVSFISCTSTPLTYTRWPCDAFTCMFPCVSCVREPSRAVAHAKVQHSTASTTEERSICGWGAQS